MPRNDSGVYSLPAGSIVATGSNIEASQHNGPLNDLVSDANAARPIVAGGTGATTRDAASRNLNVLFFDTRTALKTWWDANTVPSDGVVLFAGQEAYRCVNGSTVIPDLLGLEPLFRITPNHFAENTTPGSTSMRVAIKRAADCASLLAGGGGTDFGEKPGGTVHFLAEDYLCDGTVILEMSNAGLALVGEPGRSRIVTNDANPIFRFNEAVITSGENITVTTNQQSGHNIRDLIFENLSATSNSTCIRAGKVNVFTVSGCHFIDFSTALDFHRAVNAYITKNRFWNKSRTATAEAFIRFQGTEEGGETKTGSGNYITQNEFIGNNADSTLQLRGVHIQSSDGTYYTENHAIFMQEEVAIDPDATPQNNKIVDAKIRTGYKDASLDGGGHITIGGSVRAAGGGLYQDIEISGVRLRGGYEQNEGIKVSVTDAGGFVAAMGGIENIQISGCNFNQHVIRGITVEGANSGKVPVIGLSIMGNTFRESRGNYGAMLIDAVSATVIGNTFEKENIAPAFVCGFNLTGAETGRKSLIHKGSDFSGSLYTDATPYEMTGTGGAHVQDGGHVYKTSGFSQNVERTAMTVGTVSALLWTHDFTANEQAGLIKASVIGTSTDDDNKSADYEFRVRVIRNSAGAISPIGGWPVTPQVAITNITAANERPVDIVPMTGDAFVADMAIALGEVIVNAGNAYLAIVSDGFASAVGPTHTSGAALLGGVRYLYLGPEDTDRIALVVAAEQGTTFQWIADVDFKATT